MADTRKTPLPLLAYEPTADLQSDAAGSTPEGAPCAPKYSFVFDKAKDSWVCSVHGEVDQTGWIRCWAGCNEGWMDAYEEDPCFFDPGDLERCRECGGKGGWKVCGQCNANNPDVEW